MQRQVCQKFAESQGWEIIKEVSEKGVSGFKVSAKDRDAIVELQRDAMMGEFDILLIFMFDRLGRKEDETPFVVEWFVNNGIEVWSATEGQQRFDSHVDKLMNYIRYWQASGESIKTSIRTKTRLGQIVQEGHFRGGIAPYGYQLVKRGRLSKKNQELYEIQINEQEAVIVKKIFDLASNYGYGGRRIATELTNVGFFNRSGEAFQFSSIQNIMRNVAYTGILRSGESISPIFPELQIIDVETFERVRELRLQRTKDYEGKCSLPRIVRGNALLSGNVYCGHCGGRIFATTARRSHHPSGEQECVERIPIYKCYNRTQHQIRCTGQTTYTAAKVDAVVRQYIDALFDHATKGDDADIIQQQHNRQLDEYNIKLKHAMAERGKATRELAKCDSLMLSAIEGTGPFCAEDLSRRMQSLKVMIVSFDDSIAQAKSDIEESSVILDEFRAKHTHLQTYSNLFRLATPDIQKMIAASVIESVRVYKDYSVEIRSYLTQAQFYAGISIQA